MEEAGGRARGGSWGPVLVLLPALALAWTGAAARLEADVLLTGTAAPSDAALSPPASAASAGMPSPEASSGTSAPLAASATATAGPASGPELSPGAAPVSAEPVSAAPSASGPPPSGAGSPQPSLELTLPGRAPLDLEPLPGSLDAPRFAVGPAASYAGLGVRWRSTEKMLELRPAGAQPARLVLGSGRVVFGDRLFRLPRPLELAAGAPSLDRKGLLLLLGDLGAPGLAAAPPEAGPGSGTASALEGGAPAPGIPGVFPASPSPSPSPAGPVPAFGEPLSEPEPGEAQDHAAARPLTGARISTIVIDPGHGGKDPGARGPDGLREKDVCLDIALRLRRELARRDPDLRVVLTRDGDYFVPLSGRTRIANRVRGDLFVSIHNNASSDPEAHGTQVFFFDSQSSDRAAADLSLRENGEANQLDILMTDLAKSVVRDQSIGFATLMQRALGRDIELKRRRVSYAPFYVLARTEMPAILVEVAFITNPREEALLGSPDFRQSVAAGMALGIENYVRLVSGRP